MLCAHDRQYSAPEYKVAMRVEPSYLSRVHACAFLESALVRGGVGDF
jgi:hypothetical protein